VVLLVLESDGACTSLNGHCAIKTKVLQGPYHCVITNCIIYYILSIHNYISAVTYIYAQVTLWQHVSTVRRSSSDQ